MKCYGCRKKRRYLDNVPWRMCSDCTEALLESFAAIFDPTYDPKQLNTWERCWCILRRMWPDLPFDIWRPGSEHLVDCTDGTT